jgi:hypothetical protein
VSDDVRERGDCCGSAMHSELAMVDATPKAIRVRFPSGHIIWLPKPVADWIAELEQRAQRAEDNAAMLEVSGSVFPP